MENGRFDRIIDIIEDHEAIVNVLKAIDFAMQTKTPLPEYIPALNDTDVMDILGNICTNLNTLRNIKKVRNG